MAVDDANLKLTQREISAAFESTAGPRIPPILTIDEAAALLRIPKATLYDWRSRGLLSGCCRKVGKHLRFFRDRVIEQAFNKGIGDYGK
jgi:excisionase family DNA binding protein